MGAIKAITFDLWDTLVIDDSDEAKRAEQGLRSKFDERRHLLWEALNADGPIDLETVCLAYSVGDAAFNKVWKEHHITWPIAERLSLILSELGRELPEDSFNAVARARAPGQALQAVHRLRRHRVTGEVPAPAAGRPRLGQAIHRICLLRRGRPQQAAPLNVRLGGEAAWRRDR